MPQRPKPRRTPSSLPLPLLLLLLLPLLLPTNTHAFFAPYTHTHTRTSTITTMSSSSSSSSSSPALTRKHHLTTLLSLSSSFLLLTQTPLPTQAAVPSIEEYNDPSAGSRVKTNNYLNGGKRKERDGAGGGASVSVEEVKLPTDPRTLLGLIEKELGNVRVCVCVLIHSDPLPPPTHP
jgi:hypothetical protein